MSIAARAKALGAFYTDPVVARFLLRWALRDKGETLLDLSFGGGVFLEEAARRFRALGGEVAGAVYGVEVDAEVHARVAPFLAHEGVRADKLVLADFFDLDPGPRDLGAFDAVVGNPPFIRYQRFGSAASSSRASPSVVGEFVGGLFGPRLRLRQARRPSSDGTARRTVEGHLRAARARASGALSLASRSSPSRRGSSPGSAKTRFSSPKRRGAGPEAAGGSSWRARARRWEFTSAPSAASARPGTVCPRFAAPTPFSAT